MPAPPEAAWPGLDYYLIEIKDGRWFSATQPGWPAVLALGYAGWGPGQLDSEILDNGWLTSDRGDELIFGSDDNGKWRAALGALGIDPLRLSPDAGHA